MLGKVFKYEMKALGRQLLPFMGLALGMGVLLRVLFHLSGLIWLPAQNAVEGICMLFGMLAAIAVIAGGLIAVVVRFYQSTVASEAYLTFTLPVKTRTHIWGRAWAGLIYTTLSMVTGFAVLLIAIPDAWAALVEGFSNPVVMHMGGIGESRVITLPSGQAVGLYAILCIFLILMLLVALFQFYASIALGPAITQNRIVGGVLAYMILNTVESIITIPFVLLPLAFTIGLREAEWSGWFQTLANATDSEVTRQVTGFIALILGLCVVVNGLFTVVHYLITKRFLGTRLNLE